MGIFTTLTTFGAGYVTGAMTGSRAKQQLSARVDQLPDRAKDLLPPSIDPRANGTVDVRPIREVMTADPHSVSTTSTLQEAAQRMAQGAIGNVLVQDKTGHLAGIVTDRDLAIRGVADGRDPTTTTVQEVLTVDIATLAPTDTVQDAIEQMRARDIRRLPVIEDGRAIGIVSLGDISMQTEPGSVLSDISSASPDR